MPGTITKKGSTVLVNGTQKVTLREPGSKTITQTGQGVHATTWTVGTTEEVMPLGEIATLGRFAIVNIDPTNYVDIGPEVAGAMAGCIRLKPGEDHEFRSKPGVIWRGQANTAPCKVDIKICED